MPASSFATACKPWVSFKNRLSTPRGNPILTEGKKRSNVEQARRRACWCAQVADETRGRDILVLDLHELTPLVDFFVLATATSRRHMHAVADAVDQMMEEHGERRMGIEGYDASRWILLDYGDLVIHVLDEEGRSFYGLEDLWADAPHVAWQETPLPR